MGRFEQNSAWLYLEYTECTIAVSAKDDSNIKCLSYLFSETWDVFMTGRSGEFAKAKPLLPRKPFQLPSAAALGSTAMTSEIFTFQPP